MSLCNGVVSWYNGDVSRCNGVVSWCNVMQL